MLLQTYRYTGPLTNVPKLELYLAAYREDCEYIRDALLDRNIDVLLEDAARMWLEYSRGSGGWLNTGAFESEEICGALRTILERGIDITQAGPRDIAAEEEEAIEAEAELLAP